MGIYSHPAVPDLDNPDTSLCRANLSVLNFFTRKPSLLSQITRYARWILRILSVWDIGVLVYTFELGLPSFARLSPQNHSSKLYAQSHTPKTIRL